MALQVRHNTVPELGIEAIGLGSLDYKTLSTASNPVIWDFELRTSSNAVLPLTATTNLSVINVPDGGSGELLVIMGETGTEQINFSNTVTRTGQMTNLLNTAPGSITKLIVKKYGSQLIVLSSALPIFDGTAPGLIPSSVGVPAGSVFTLGGWGKLTANSTTPDFDNKYLNRANHTGTQSSTTISDFQVAVRSNPINTLAPPTGNVNLNNRRITNLADPVNPLDAVNAIYVSDALTSIENLLFNQMFS